jgi:hypothetical protein
MVGILNGTRWESARHSCTIWDQNEFTYIEGLDLLHGLLHFGALYVLSDEEALV